MTPLTILSRKAGWWDNLIYVFHLVYSPGRSQEYPGTVTGEWWNMGNHCGIFDICYNHVWTSVGSHSHGRGLLEPTIGGSFNGNSTMSAFPGASGMFYSHPVSGSAITTIGSIVPRTYLSITNLRAIGSPLEEVEDPKAMGIVILSTHLVPGITPTASSEIGITY